MDSTSYAYMDTAGLMSIRNIQREHLVHASKQAALQVPNVTFATQATINEMLTGIQAVNAELNRRGIASADPAPETPVANVIQHYHGTVINAPNAQGVVGHADSVAQDFSTSTINTAGGAVVQGDLHPAPAGALPPQASPVPSALQTLLPALEAAVAAQPDEELSDQLQMLLLQARELRRKAGDLQTRLRELAAATPALAELVGLAERL